MMMMTMMIDDGDDDDGDDDDAPLCNALPSLQDNAAANAEAVRQALLRVLALPHTGDPAVTQRVAAILHQTRDRVRQLEVPPCSL